MFCSFCGKNLNSGTKFCSYCGKELPDSHEAGSQEAPVQAAKAQRPSQIPAPAAKNPKPAKRTEWSLLFGMIGVVLGAVVLAAVFFFTGMISFGGAKSNDSAVAKIEGPGYDTPEEAAEAYLIALKNQDTGAMVATFAVESYVDNYDFEAWCERLQAYVPTFEMKLPTSNVYNSTLDVETRRASIINQITNQYFTYNVPSVRLGTTISLAENPQVASVIEKDTDHYVFSDLEITGTMSPNDITNDIYSIEKNQENLLTQTKPFGVHDLKDVSNVVITFEANGETWYFCPQLIRYEGRWYVQSLTGNAAAIMGMDSAYGGIVKESWVE